VERGRRARGPLRRLRKGDALPNQSEQGMMQEEKELSVDLSGLRAAFCLTASYCTLERAVAQMELLRRRGCAILPVISFNVRDHGSRFGTPEQWRQRISDAARAPIIDAIAAAEPLGPQDLADLAIIAPMSGNTCAKLAHGITDTPVLMAAKSLLRVGRPLVAAIASNDALSANAVNLGRLLNTKHIFLVPFAQDDPQKKPNSLVADMARIPYTVAQALNGRQIQPLLTTFS